MLTMRSRGTATTCQTCHSAFNPFLKSAPKSEIPCGCWRTAVAHCPSRFLCYPLDTTDPIIDISKYEPCDPVKTVWRATVGWYQVGRWAGRCVMLCNADPMPCNEKTGR